MLTGDVQNLTHQGVVCIKYKQNTLSDNLSQSKLLVVVTISNLLRGMSVYQFIIIYSTHPELKCTAQLRAPKTKTQPTKEPGYMS